MSERLQQFAELIISLPFLAFSKDIVKEIGKRDNWTCQNCGNTWDQGYMVTAAHYDHNKENPDYNVVSNGRILCIPCHAREEVANGNEWGAQRLLDMGLYNIHYAREHGKVYLTLDQL